MVALFALVTVSAWPGAAAKTVLRRSRSTYNIRFETFEPTIGATSNGDLYFSTTPSHGVAIGWSANIAKSRDGGRSWKQVGPKMDSEHTMPPETNDPYIYVDPGTNRVFTFHMAPILTCSIASYSDNGGKSWETNPRGCSVTGVWDHQTMVAAKPRSVETNGYPNVLHQCVNAVYAAMCSRSLDGGETWGPSVPAYLNEEIANTCGAQHGHLTASPDGRVYLPTSRCGTRPMVYISNDDGLTWRKSVIADKETPFVDPTVSVDSKGNLYAAFIDESGWLYYATSRNNGKKWSKAIRIAKGYTVNMPVIVAGDPGKIAIAYPATDDLPKGYDTHGYLTAPPEDLIPKVAWGANYTVSYNGLASHPRFRTVVSTGTDPLARGRMCGRGTRCSYQVDFIEAVLGPDGRPYASFADGCMGKCAHKSSGAQKGGTGVGLMTTLPSGPRLCKSVCWRYKGAKKAKVNMSEALAFANTWAQKQSSLEHANLSAGDRSLMDEAAQRRLDFIYH